MIMLSCFAVVEPAAHASQLSQRLVLCCMLLSQRLMIMLSCFAVVEPTAHIMLSCFAVVEPAAHDHAFMLCCC